MFYWIAHFFVTWYLKIFYRFKVEGLENLPPLGPVLAASNHRSYMDPVAVGCALNRSVHYMAKEELFKVPILNLIIVGLKAFPVKRGTGDRQAFKTALNLLKKGEILGLFPEGTRSKTGKLGSPHPGVGLLALKGNCPVVPIALLGTDKKFGPITVRIGKPIIFQEEKIDKEATEKVSKAIMNEIEHLLQEVQDGNN